MDSGDFVESGSGSNEWAGVTYQARRRADPVCRIGPGSRGHFESAGSDSGGAPAIVPALASSKSARSPSSMLDRGGGPGS